VTIDALGPTTLAYNTVGLLTGTILPPTGGVTKQTSYAYDVLNRLTTETWFTAAATVNIMTFTYDNVGNELTAQNTGSAYTMTYDADNRVSAVQEPYGLVLTFTYDGAGNRTLVQDSLGGLTTSVYDAVDLLTSQQFSASSGATPLRVDLAYQGNDLLSTLTRYSALAGLTTELAGTTSYMYDGAGNMTGINDFDSAHTLLISWA
jgi:YD repeat-containing protein